MISVAGQMVTVLEEQIDKLDHKAADTGFFTIQPYTHATGKVGGYV